jgi:NADH dehydrogenase
MATHVVTGAFSYTGKYIARRLLAEGHTLRTLTGRPRSDDPLAAEIEAFPLDFANTAALANAMRGADTLYNTYWIRFARGAITFEGAIENSRALIAAAVDAGVRRIVHVSAMSASSASPLAYFRGKGLIEEAIHASGLSYGIVRPSLVFGLGDVLVNNIAWTLRRMPVMAAASGGRFEFQPVYVNDVAEIAVAAGREDANVTWDAVGPDRYTTPELIHLVAEAIGRRAFVMPLPPRLFLASSTLLGLLLHDVIMTKDELASLTGGLLVSPDPPRGRTSLREWARENASMLGRKYASEVARHYR